MSFSTGVDLITEVSNNNTISSVTRQLPPPSLQPSLNLNMNPGGVGEADGDSFSGGASSSALSSARESKEGLRVYVPTVSPANSVWMLSPPPPAPFISLYVTVFVFYIFSSRLSSAFCFYFSLFPSFFVVLFLT